MTIKLKTSENNRRKALLRMERRHRNYVYNTIDTFCDLTTFIDFYSKDLVDILINARVLLYLLNKNKVVNSNEITLEHILYSFVLTKNTVQPVLKYHNIDTKNIEEYFYNSEETFSKKKNKNNFFDFLKNKFESFYAKYKNFEKKLLKRKIKIREAYTFSPEVIELFSKSISNARDRFKTPVITPEIFFIGLMESKQSKVSKWMDDILGENNDWYLLRYKLIKRIYFEEICIKEDVLKNQRYFAYLLKTRLSSSNVEKLIRTKAYPLAVSHFRDKLVQKALKQDLLLEIKKDIYRSARLTATRKYSRN